MSNTPRRNNGAVLAAAALLAASLGAILASPPSAPLDDTYIHLVFGRNLTGGSFMEFNRGEPSTGLTSPLWIIPSALASIAGSGAPVVLMAMSTLAASAAVLLSGNASWLLLLTGPLLFHAASGMETALAALLAIAVTSRLSRGGGRDLTLGMLLALAALARPEMAVLCIPAGAAVLRRPSALAARLTPCAAVLALWALWNLHASGSALPSTFYAKTARWDFQDLPALAARLLLSAPLALPAAVAGAVVWARRRNPASACIALLAVAALVTQPNRFSQLRYHVPWLCAAMPAAESWLSERTGAGMRKLLRTAAILAMLPGALFFMRQRIGAAGDVMQLDVRPAMLLDSLSEPGDVVAAGDIGAIAWFSSLRIIDLDGLVTPQRLPGPGMEGWGWIGRRAEWLVAFPGQYSGLVRDAGEDLSFVAGFSSPFPVICGEDTVSIWRISRSGRPFQPGSEPL